LQPSLHAIDLYIPAQPGHVSAVTVVPGFTLSSPRSIEGTQPHLKRLA
jgi:hypothetical protein